MKKVLTRSDRLLMSGGRWLTREHESPEPPPPPPTRYVYINQTTGGTISASPMSGVDGDIITLSNTPDSSYTFDGYTISGATLYDGNKFILNGSDVTISASWTYVQPTRYVHLNQTTGGTISASPMSGVDGDTVTLSNSPATYYEFNGYTVNGATLYSGNKFNFNGSDVTCSASWTYRRGPMPTEGLLYLSDFYGVKTKYISAARKNYYYDNYRYSGIPYHSNTDSYSDQRNINYGSSNPSFAKGTFTASGTPGLKGMPASYAGQHFGSVSVDTSITVPRNFPYNETSKNVQREYSTAFWASCSTNTPSTGCNYVVTNGLEFEKWNQNAPWRIKYFVSNDCTLVSGEYGTFTSAGEQRASQYNGYVIVTTLDLYQMHHFNTYLNTMDTDTGKAFYEIYLDGKLLLRVRGDWDKIIHKWNDTGNNSLDPFPIAGTFGAGLIVSEYCLYEGRVIHYPDEPIAL